MSTQRAGSNRDRWKGAHDANANRGTAAPVLSAAAKAALAMLLAQAPPAPCPAVPQLSRSAEEAEPETCSGS
jgi:hypothetical protein